MKKMIMVLLCLAFITAPVYASDSIRGTGHVVHGNSVFFIDYDKPVWSGPSSYTFSPDDDHNPASIAVAVKNRNGVAANCTFAESVSLRITKSDVAAAMQVARDFGPGKRIWVRMTIGGRCASISNTL